MSNNDDLFSPEETAEYDALDALRDDLLDRRRALTNKVVARTLQRGKWTVRSYRDRIYLVPADEKAESILFGFSYDERFGASEYYLGATGPADGPVELRVETNQGRIRIRSKSADLVNDIEKMAIHLGMDISVDNFMAPCASRSLMEKS